MLTPDQLKPQTIQRPGARPGTRAAIIPTVNGLPARVDLMQRPSTSQIGRERHGIGFLMRTSDAGGAWAPLAEWRWEAN